MKNRIKV